MYIEGKWYNETEVVSLVNDLRRTIVELELGTYEAYEKGCQDGYREGHNDGYAEGRGDAFSEMEENS